MRLPDKQCALLAINNNPKRPAPLNVQFNLPLSTPPLRFAPLFDVILFSLPPYSSHHHLSNSHPILSLPPSPFTPLTSSPYSLPSYSLPLLLPPPPPLPLSPPPPSVHLLRYSAPHKRMDAANERDTRNISGNYKRSKKRRAQSDAPYRNCVCSATTGQAVGTTCNQQGSQTRSAAQCGV